MNGLWGFGKREITPEKELELEGYAGPYRAGKSVLSPLFARCAVYISDGGKNELRERDGIASGRAAAAVIVALDLIGVPESLGTRLRNAAAKAAGTAPEAVLISCTHTHSGPLTGITRARDDMMLYPELYPEYDDILVKTVGELAGECAQKAEPARLFFSYGTSRISRNRHKRLTNAKNPLSDHNIRVLRVENARGRNIGIIVQSAAHPVFLGPESNAYCAEWPGDFCARMDEKYGVGLFIQGGSGDLSPLPLTEEEGIPRIPALGQRLAEDTERVMAGGETEVGGEVRAAMGHFAVPRIPHTKEALASIEAQIAGLHKSDQGFMVGLIPYFERYRNLAMEYAKNGIPPVMIPLQVLMVGELPFFALPFEPFSAITMGIAREAGKMGRRGFAVTAGYANGDFGYLPTAKAMREGGYEAETAPLLYSMYGTWAPSAPTVVKKAMLWLYEGLLEKA